MKKLIVIVLLSSCAGSRVPNISTPSKKQIRKGMEQSTSEYRNEMSAKYFYQTSLNK